MIDCPVSSEWDYVIAGAGTAGCILASRLSAISGLRILVIEAGGRYSRLLLGVPLPGMRQTVAHSWKYFTAQQRHLGGRRLSLPMGKVTGGSSSVNAMMYVRGSARNFDRWSEAGQRGWSYREVLPYFRRSERQQHGASEFHGGGGELDVSDPRHRAPFSDAFVEACLEQGMPHCGDFNVPAPDGAGFYQVTQRAGERVSTSRAFLDPASRRPELRVVTQASVQRLLVEGSRVTGVEFTQGGRLCRAEAGREVVLSAGAIQSPKLLLLSGIGPAGDLRRLGIRVRLDLPGVGANLQDHVRVPVLFETPRPSPGKMSNWVPAGIDYVVRRRGVMTSNCCEAGALVRSGPGVAEPDLQFVTHFQSGLYPGTVDLQVCLLSTRSRGSVRLISADPELPPRIDPDYLGHESEVDALVAGVRIARRLAASRALQRFPLMQEVLPGREVESASELAAHVRSTAETCYHPAGTCAMGEVVDERLRLQGLDGLRIADASVMPELINGNTLAATAMIAEKAAAMILEERHAQPA